MTELDQIAELTGPHVDGDLPSTQIDLASNRSPPGQDFERLGADSTGIPQVPGEDPQSVATLFRLGTIRVEDPQPKRLAIAAGVLQQNAV